MIFFKNTVLDSEGKAIKFQALDNDTLLGECTLVLGEKYAEVTNLSFEQNAMFIAEGLLKSAYNYAALKNYYMAKCSVNGIDTLLKKLNFQLKDGEYVNDIPSVLMGSCGSCGSK